MTAGYATTAALTHLQRELTAHDKAVLRSVSDLHFVSGAQLARMHFGGSDPEVRARAARRALLRLTRLGCLVRLPRAVGGVRAGSAGFVYALGLLGQRLAVQREWQPPRRPRRSVVPGTLFLDHALAVSELHTLLIEADREGRFEALTLSAEPACHRQYAGGIGTQRSTLKPDSYLRLGVGEFEDSYFIEVDMGTEGSRTILTKLRAYVAYQASGTEQAARGVFPKTLWLVPDEQRAEAVRGCIGRLPVSHRELFAVAAFGDVLTTLGVRETNTHLT